MLNILQHFFIFCSLMIKMIRIAGRQAAGAGTSGTGAWGGIFGADLLKVRSRVGTGISHSCARQLMSKCCTYNLQHSSRKQKQV